jgi:hypothetical protein
MRHDKAGDGGFELERVQRWMQAVVVHPGDVDEALASEDAAREIPGDRLTDLVKPSKTLTASERVEIYHGMYLLRMEEALASDYPAVKHYLGDNEFWDIVKDYVQVHPSRSYTLNRLGDHFPIFLLEESGRKDALFLQDLARLELAITEAFDAEESPVLDAEAVQSIPAERWPGARLKPTASFRLLTFRHRVLEHLDAMKRDQPSPSPSRKSERVAVYRRDYSVYRTGLSKAEYELLSSLAGGRTLGEAVAAAASRLKSAESQKKIFKWFRDWISEGMFSAVEA